MKDAGKRIATAVIASGIMWYLGVRAERQEGAAAFLDKGKYFNRVLIWAALVVALGYSLKESELRDMLVVGGLTGIATSILIQVVTRHVEALDAMQAQSLVNAGKNAAGLSTAGYVADDAADADLGNVVNLEEILKGLENSTKEAA